MRMRLGLMRICESLGNTGVAKRAFGEIQVNLELHSGLGKWQARLVRAYALRSRGIRLE